VTASGPNWQQQQQREQLQLQQLLHRPHSSGMEMDLAAPRGSQRMQQQQQQKDEQLSSLVGACWGAAGTPSGQDTSTATPLQVWP